MAASPSTFLITGAGRGIGRGLSRQLLQAGHRVFLVDIDSTELNHTADTLAKTYKRQEQFDSVAADVRDAAQVEDAVSRARTLFDGKLDCLINNAAYTGGVGKTKLADMTLLEWNRTLETNLTGPMLVTKACLPMLSAARGCVIHMSSTRAAQSELHNEAYSMTKAGLIGLAQSMAVSLGPEGIRVNAIVPGWIHVENECKEADHPKHRRKWEDGLTEDDMRWQLTGRVGKVDDITKAVMYLEANDGVTGVEMVVDGGVTRKMVYPE